MKNQDGEYTGEDTEQMFHEQPPELSRRKEATVKSPIEVGSANGPEGRAADFDLFGITGSMPKPDLERTDPHANPFDLGRVTGAMPKPEFSKIQMTPDSVSFPDGKTRNQEDFRRLKGFKERSQVYATFMWVMLAVAVAYGVFWLATETTKAPPVSRSAVNPHAAHSVAPAKKSK